MDTNQPMNLIEIVCMMLGISLSLTQIETLAGIILMGVQIILIVARLIMSLIQRKKNNDVAGAISDTNAALDELAALAEKEKAKQAEIAKKNEEKQRKEQEKIARENEKIDQEIARLNAKRPTLPVHRKED